MTTAELDGLAAEALRAGSGMKVVLDEFGEILIANENWLRLSDVFDADPKRCGPGANYFAICRKAAAEGEPIAQQVLDTCAAVLADGQARTVEYTCTAPGELYGPPAFWYRLRITPMSNARLLLEHIDVTDEHTRVQRANESASQAAFERLVLKALSQPVIATDVNGLVTYWNDAACDLFGFSADEALGRPITEVTVPDASQEQAAAIMEALSRGESWTGEFCVQHRDGTRFPARVTDIPILDANGQVVGIVGVSDDLRPHYAREAEQQHLRDLESQLLQSQKLEALGTVAGGVAHEFNNVLAAILGHAEWLRDGIGVSEEGHKAAESIVEASRRGREIVHSLLAFSRPQSGERSPIDAEHWLRSALRLVEPILPTEVRVTCQFDASPTTICANATHLTQILLNLASNAGYAMRTSERRELRIRCAREPQRVRAGDGSTEWFVLEVTDTGTGMDESALARLFDPFFTTKPVGDGTGLGLPVVHGLVTAHEGTITVESTPGIGTTVRISLPVWAGPPAPVAPPAPPRISLGDVHVLMVDDDAMVLRALTRTLEHAGVKVTGFTDPEQALRAVRDSAAPSPWTVAVLDYAMPGIRGDELATRLAGITPHLPVILCSGNVSEIVGLPPQVREVVEKPIAAAALLEVLQRVGTPVRH